MQVSVHLDHIYLLVVIDQRRMDHLHLREIERANYLLMDFIDCH